MVRLKQRGIALSLVILISLSNFGCCGPSCFSSPWGGQFAGSYCDSCPANYGDGGQGDISSCYDECNSCRRACCPPRCRPRCRSICFGLPSCCGGIGHGALLGWLIPHSLAIPDELPVGAVQRASFHQMQTNAEAADFILYQMDFVAQTSELTPDGKDKVNEIGARMRSSPFPVLVERTFNNADPELDAHRRDLIAQILYEKGNPDANNRVFVSPSYGLGKSSLEAAPEFYQHTYMFGGQNNLNGGGGGGFGGGGGGGGGFGGGGGGFGGGGGGGGFGGGGFGI